jgi:hypothetical protein
MLLDKLTGRQLVKKFPAFYVTRRFITALTTAFPRLCIVVRNMVIFYGEKLLAPCPTPNPEDHPLSTLRDCLFSVFAATLHL